ncbi:MAG: flagellar protein FlaG [Alphaproteobacteria bacterium]
MIEAANSVLSNASALRSNSADQLASSRAATVSVAAADSSVAPQAPQAPFISPYISVDLNYNKAVLQIRDSDTGDVQQQFPTESRLRAQRQASQAIETRELTSPEVSVPDVSISPAADSVAATTPEIITVQDVTSAPPANTASQLPQVAAATLAANAQAPQSAPSSVSVLA